MTTKRTTLVLVLLAGTKGTVDQIDPLLGHVQAGINTWTSANPPIIFCMYYRWSGSDVQSYRFRVDVGTLTFLPSGLLSAFPPTGATALTGDVATQVGAFLGDVAANLPGDGPIRLVFAAHGFSGLGFHPSESLGVLRLVLSLLGSPFNSLLRNQSLADRIELLSSQLIRGGPAPAALPARAGQALPILKLDDAATMIGNLPVARLQTLILHACQLSGIESIASLKLVPHHIACESDMSYQMRLRDWFAVLGDPLATDAAISTACFNSLKIPSTPASPNTKGCFSSHRTSGVDLMLDKLDDLGTHLRGFVQHGPVAAVNSIVSARFGSQISSLSVDLSRFCSLLITGGAITASIAQAVIDAIPLQQVEPVLMTNGWAGGAFGSYKGINVFLPEKGNKDFGTSVLPNTLHAEAPNWLEFLDAWMA